ncbi:MAG: ornithine cyclodeaminase family protein [Candidatus Kariarchaeaceae archaeon]|jgi:ornithine cyclodeaminase
MVLVLCNDDVKSLLSMEVCIDLVAQAHGKLHKNMAYQPLRKAMIDPSVKGILAAMPAYIGGDDPVLGLKVVSVFHDNLKYGLESHQATILLLNPDTGRLKAIIDGAEITALRTAAASAVATKFLATKEATNLSILGVGVQAHTHLNAISLVRPIENIAIWNRSKNRALEFVNKYSKDYSINHFDTVKQAVEDADIICTVTASTDPILKGDWVKEGTHINAVGSCTPNARELDTELIMRSSLFTDVVESAMNESGDILIPINEGKLNHSPILIELGQLVNEGHPGRTSDTEITIYKSLGLGIQDLSTAQYVFNEAKQSGLGTIISI